MKAIQARYTKEWPGVVASYDQRSPKVQDCLTYFLTGMRARLFHTTEGTRLSEKMSCFAYVDDAILL